MPKLRALALSIGLAAAAALLASPQAGAAKKKAAKKPAIAPACQDYYAQANADWLKANLLVAGTGLQSALGQLAERAHQQQFDLLDEDMRSAQGGVAKLLGDFWASGLDEAAVERDGANPIAPLLSRIDSIRRTKDVPAAIAALHQVGIPVLFNFGPDVDLDDMTRHIGYLSQGGLGLPDPAYYTRTDADAKALFDRYRDYVGKLLILAGTRPERLQADVQAVIDLETRIARASRPPSLLRDPRANYAPLAVAGLDKQFRHLQLQAFLQSQGVTDDSVSLANPALFAQLDAMVDQLKPDQWKAYLRYQVAAAMAPYLSKAWRDVDYGFRGTVLRGETAPLPRREQVLAAMNLAAGPMLGHEYAARYLPADARARAQEIAVQVRDALGRGIERAAWMAPATREQAKAKLAQLKIEVGVPARDLDYTVQPMGRGSFGGNMLIASTWRHREEMKRIGRGNADRRWPVLPQQPALAYDPAQNRLIVTAAMLQPPVFDMARESAANYGAFGALVGHELTHGFDGIGRNVDATGAVRDWWTPADAAAWESVLSALSVQYGAYPWPGLPGTFVAGAQTRVEDAADLGGVELALDAMQAALPAAAAPPAPAAPAKKSAQPALPDPAQVAKQFFYQGWARLWPQQMSADVAQRLAATDVHAPGQWRANGPLADDPGFGAAFSCAAGTPMQRPAPQQVKVWR
ncbi:MAG TPA: M13 family metallopeptidase [Luteimonas sp.]|nr:M13 family metallopeptidase [Luteimonas sp.]